MGFLENFLKAQHSPLPMNWKVLEDEPQIDSLVETSFQKPVVVFKHSIHCGISAMTKHQLEDNWDFSTEELDFYYLDLINRRSVSNLVASRFGVVHQSPQIILIHQGQAVYNESHHMISIKALREALKEAVV